MAEDDADYKVEVRKCQQCGGPAHSCEQDDSTCRHKSAARIFLSGLTATGHVSEDDFEEVAHALAALLRKTEDGAWERLSVARTRSIDRAEELLRSALFDEDEDLSLDLEGKINEWLKTRPRR